MDDSYATQYADISATNWWSRSRHEFVRELAYEHASESLESLLDVGCLNGSLLETFEALPKRAGIDISGTALELVSADLRSQVRFARASGLHLPYASASFDVVTSVDVIEHIDDDAASLREMARVLRPGGTLVIVVPAHNWLRTSRDDHLGHLRRYERSGLEAVIGSVGLDVDWSTYFAGSMVVPLLGLRLFEWLTSRRIRAVRHAGQYRSGWFNEFLYRVHALEARLGLRLRIPFGSAVACVARRQSEPYGTSVRGVSRGGRLDGGRRRSGSQSSKTGLTT